ncbi:homogentisate 1,2-dioxygenase [Sphingomonas sp. GC_Shp_1]|uniref:homogentisate 1,2-dioxygenase n=1 Tax=unclassified Sphingomonas TaxID=196159 RepID=UPI0022699D2D
MATTWMRKAAMLAGALLATGTAPAVAQGMAEHQPACPARPVAPPAALRGWTAMTPIQAGERVGLAPVLTIGRSVRATLRDEAGVKLAAPSTRSGEAPGTAGLFQFAVARAGRYRIALGEGVWIDVVSAGKPLASVAHSHGPDCSGIRKMVDFDLKPGRYVLQVTGSKTASLPLMVARVTG